MARFCTLFSGSSGNCTYIGSGSDGILVDAGVSAKRIEQALYDREILPESIRAILITHEHIDHVKGIKTFAKRYRIPLYGSHGTLEALAETGLLPPDAELCEMNGVQTVGDMQVSAFRTSHDSAQSVGYTVETATGRRVGICTDTGFITDEAWEAIQGCHLVQMESNHDVDMLRSGAYPYPLKQRILSDCGHLSNDTCANALPTLANNGATRFVLAHLSRDNNTPTLAYAAATNALVAAGLTDGIDYLLKVAAPISEERWMVF